MVIHQVNSNIIVNCSYHTLLFNCCTIFKIFVKYIRIIQIRWNINVVILNNTICDEYIMSYDNNILLLPLYIEKRYLTFIYKNARVEGGWKGRDGAKFSFLITFGIKSGKIKKLEEF